MPIIQLSAWLLFSVLHVLVVDVIARSLCSEAKFIMEVHCVDKQGKTWNSALHLIASIKNDLFITCHGWYETFIIEGNAHSSAQCVVSRYEWKV